MVVLKETKLPKSLECERIGDLAILRLARPEKRNAINLETLLGIKHFFQALSDEIKGVIITGSCEHFSAGLDLSELAEKDAPAGMMHSREWHEVFHLIQYAHVPVVAVLHGAVVGAGLELASAAHIRVADASAFYALPEGQRGIFLGGGGSVRLSRLVGVARVMDLMMTGRSINAQDGYLCGFSQYVVDAGQGMETGIDVATRASGNAPLSNFAIIHGLPRICEMSPEDGLLTEALLTGVVQSSAEAKERLIGFLQKRTEKVKRPAL
ncbi:MAG: crotonase/enoyl-CoA hydratase family protein [Candidatus Binatia bacterium]